MGWEQRFRLERHTCQGDGLCGELKSLRQLLDRATVEVEEEDVRMPRRHGGSSTEPVGRRMLEC